MSPSISQASAFGPAADTICGFMWQTGLEPVDVCIELKANHPERHTSIDGSWLKADPEVEQMYAIIPSTGPLQVAGEEVTSYQPAGEVLTVPVVEPDPIDDGTHGEEPLDAVDHGGFEDH